MRRKKTIVKDVVEIVEKQFFKSRVCPNDPQLGEFLYDFFIRILEGCGEETRHVPQGMGHVMFFSQKESHHNTRMFIVDPAIGHAIYDFRKNIHDQLEAFAKKNQAKGKNILLQLNSGEISMKDFEKNI
jgi:hypothetical protein